MTVRLVKASERTAAQRERLKLPEDSTALVEEYRYWRPSYDVAIREETARQLAEAFEAEEAKGR